jgi:protein-disulfide isomerase
MARIAVVEFSDYECQFCARFHQTTFASIRDSYITPGKVRFAVRHLPLPRHALAFRAAEAAECGARAGRFWEMHGLLFTPPMAIDEASIVEKAKSIGIDPASFDACLSERPRARIEADIKQARELKISGTPTFLIGVVEADGRLKVDRHESGAIPAPAFARMLDDVLKRTGPKSPSP